MSASAWGSFHTRAAADLAALCARPGTVAATVGSGDAAVSSTGQMDQVPVHGDDAQGFRQRADAVFEFRHPAGALGTLTRNAAVTITGGPHAGAYTLQGTAAEDGAEVLTLVTRTGAA